MELFTCMSWHSVHMILCLHVNKNIVNAPDWWWKRTKKTGVCCSCIQCWVFFFFFLFFFFSFFFFWGVQLETQLSSNIIQHKQNYIENNRRASKKKNLEHRVVVIQSNSVAVSSFELCSTPFFQHRPRFIINSLFLCGWIWLISFANHFSGTKK